MPTGKRRQSRARPATEKNGSRHRDTIESAINAHCGTKSIALSKRAWKQAAELCGARIEELTQDGVNTVGAALEAELTTGMEASARDRLPYILEPLKEALDAVLGECDAQATSCLRLLRLAPNDDRPRMAAPFGRPQSLNMEPDIVPLRLALVAVKAFLLDLHPTVPDGWIDRQIELFRKEQCYRFATEASRGRADFELERAEVLAAPSDVDGAVVKRNGISTTERRKSTGGKPGPKRKRDNDTTLLAGLLSAEHDPRSQRASLEPLSLAVNAKRLKWGISKASRVMKTLVGGMREYKRRLSSGTLNGGTGTYGAYAEPSDSAADADE